eukprot:752197-Pelagomonas_calceolata.AAC.1
MAHSTRWHRQAGSMSYFKTQNKTACSSRLVPALQPFQGMELQAIQIWLCSTVHPADEMRRRLCSKEVASCMSNGTLGMVRRGGGNLGGHQSRASVSIVQVIQLGYKFPVVCSIPRQHHNIG